MARLAGARDRLALVAALVGPLAVCLLLVPFRDSFANTNAALVGNGGRRPAFNTGGKAYCVTAVQTYHWNNGKGTVAAGFVGLTGTGSALGGPGPVGFWKAYGPGAPSAPPNTIWRVTLSRDAPVVIRGTYSCSDSAPGTWSQNQASAGLGFCVVAGTPAIAR